MNKKLILPVISVLFVAVVLLYLGFPRTFSQIMKESVDVDPAGVERIDVLVVPFPEGGPEADYRLTKDDPAFQDLLDLLSSRRYTPMLGKPESRYITLECNIMLTFDRSCIDLSGDRDIWLSSDRHSRYIRSVNGGEAFQREILDFLLAAAPKTEAAS